MSSFLPTTLTTSPHVKHKTNVPHIMKHVIFALIPIVLFATWNFGLSALLLIITTTAACLLTEHLYTQAIKKPSSLKDNSAIITGILLGLTLPPAFPLWMAVVGSVFSILIGKMIFGGIGFNPFNPALVGRAFLQAAFPSAITTWTAALSPDRFQKLYSSTLAFPFTTPVLDATAGATPLSALKFEKLVYASQDLATGFISGSTGETSSILIILCGLYLAARKYLDWRIPVGILSTAAFISALLHLYNVDYPSTTTTLFSGGLMLGAFFMATDMVSSPQQPLGTWIYAIFIGLIVVVIRVFGGLPEGVMYAILIGNAITPQLNRLIKSRAYGTRSKT